VLRRRAAARSTARRGATLARGGTRLAAATPGNGHDERNQQRHSERDDEAELRDSLGSALGLCDRLRDREHTAAGQRCERAALEHRSIEGHDVAAIDAHEFVAFSLHDCYAEHWLPHYAELLAAVAARGRLRTLDEVAADVALAHARWT